ncbi:MAG: branched-chain amino acid ABC transporter permease [Nitrospirota bacterium]
MLLQQLVNGLTLGGVYALIALGYTMVYGILGLLNFAHGEIYMIGAYLGIIFLGLLIQWGVATHSLILALAGAFLLAALYCGAYGFTLERIAYRPLRHSHRLAPLISAIGMSIFLQNYVMLAQGSADKVFPHVLPSGGVMLGQTPVSYLQLFILVTSVALMAGLHFFVKRTKLGKAMRATAQDHRMAGLLGINTNQVISATFIIGSVLAAAAGVMIAMYYGLVNFFIGYMAGIKAFTAAVLGGIGHIGGAMLGGFLLGLMESLGAGYLSSEYKDVFAFLILIVVLIVRPTGLLGERQRERV